jgi:dienelactone hydrolase
MAVGISNVVDQLSDSGRVPRSNDYEPFARGSFTVGVRTIEVLDAARDRQFPCEVWYPAVAQHTGEDITPDTQDSYTVPLSDTPRVQAAVRNADTLAGTYPLIVFTHGSARGARRMSTFLCTHLSSHGYLVAALDHSELVAKEFTLRGDESKEERLARANGIIASRVPDVEFLLDHVLNGATSDWGIRLDPERVGIVGYSLGGWTALAATSEDRRIRAVVALAPSGSSRPKPGILSPKLNFDWGRDVPALYLVAENDTMTPLDGEYELFERTRATKQMVVLRNADHSHFLDNAEQEHENARNMQWPGDLSWIPKEMRPIAELCSEEEAHLFTRGLTVSHFDANLKQLQEARRFLAGDDLEAELAAHHIRAFLHEA